MPTTLLLAPRDFQTFLQPCTSGPNLKAIAQKLEDAFSLVYLMVELEWR